MINVALDNNVIRNYYIKGLFDNNWLYRSGLDPLSATNLCYDKNISYTESVFLNSFFKKILYDYLKRMPQFITF